MLFCTTKQTSTLGLVLRYLYLIYYIDGCTVYESLKVFCHEDDCQEDFDKVNGEMKDFFFDIFDKGYFYDNRGNKINCTNAIFILISSIFDNNYQDFINYLSKTNNLNIEGIEHKLGSAFISRITKVISFNKLTSEAIKTLMKKYVDNHHLEMEVGLIDEAFSLSELKEYDKSGLRLAYKNLKIKLLEANKIKNL